VLQTTPPEYSPATAEHENKRSVEILLPALRQGRLNVNVSQVGGVSITKAATGRQTKEGLFDWKFFNALVSPDADPSVLMDVLHHRQTMNRILEVVSLLNDDVHKILKYVLEQFWRAKEIIDSEGIVDPKHIIPGDKMARLGSLLLCSDITEQQVRQSRSVRAVPFVQRPDSNTTNPRSRTSF